MVLCSLSSLVLLRSPRELPHPSVGEKLVPTPEGMNPNALVRLLSLQKCWGWNPGPWAPSANTLSVKPHPNPGVSFLRQVLILVHKLLLIS